MGVTVTERYLDVVVQLEQRESQLDLLRLLNRYLVRRTDRPELLEAPSLAVALASTGTHALVDASADLEPLLAWLSSPDREVDLGARRLRVHVLVAGSGPALLACVGALRSVAAAVSRPAIVIWMDLSTGPLEAEGRRFEDTRVFREVRTKSLGELRVLPADFARLEDVVFSQLDVLLGARGDVPEPAARQSRRSDNPAPSRFEPPLGSVARFEELATRLLETAEDRMAARLSDLAQHWSGVMREAASEAALLIADRTHDGFKAQAEHIASRLESLAPADQHCRAVDAKSARDATVEVLRKWVEPRLEARGRWYAIGAIACLASALFGLMAGIALAPAVSR